MGLADHEVTEEELAKGAPPVPRFNTPAIAYVLAANLKKGDMVEITLSNDDKPLLTNSETLAEDQAIFCCKRASAACRPAAGRRQLYRRVKITRDGKTLIEQSTPDPRSN